jgi:hypothetical protein
MDIRDYFCNPRPSLFDLVACIALVGIGFIPGYLRGFYFCFYSIFIAVIGMNYPVVRKFKSPGLALLCLVSLAGLFIHSFVYSPKSITFQYLNFYLMFEGFGYVFFGSLIIHTLVEKSRNIRLLYFAIPFALYQSIISGVQGGRGSIVFAFAIGFIIFLILRKKYFYTAFLVMAALAFLYIKHDWFSMKFNCRIPLWKDMFFQIWEHPFIGSGFNKLFRPDNMTISTSWGNTWLFKHNDYFNILQVLGVFAAIPIAMFLRQVIQTVRRSWYIAPIIGVMVLCFVQMTMFDGDKALSILGFTALAITENERSI